MSAHSATVPPTTITWCSVGAEPDTGWAMAAWGRVTAPFSHEPIANVDVLYGNPARIARRLHHGRQRALGAAARAAADGGPHRRRGEPCPRRAPRRGA